MTIIKVCIMCLGSVVLGDTGGGRWEVWCWVRQEEVGGFSYLMAFVVTPWSLSTKESSAVLTVAW